MGRRPRPLPGLPGPHAGPHDRFRRPPSTASTGSLMTFRAQSFIRRRRHPRFVLWDRGQEVAQTGLFRKRNKLRGWRIAMTGDSGGYRRGCSGGRGTRPSAGELRARVLSVVDRRHDGLHMTRTAVARELQRRGVELDSGAGGDDPSLSSSSAQRRSRRREAAEFEYDRRCSLLKSRNWASAVGAGAMVEVRACGSSQRRVDRRTAGRGRGAGHPRCSGASAGARHA